MLNHISTIWEYRDFLAIHKSHLDVSQLKLLKSKYRPALAKLRKLDISLDSNILFPLYSHTGRPAIDPVVLVRSFVLMNHLKYSSIKLWYDDLAPQSFITEYSTHSEPHRPALRATQSINQSRLYTFSCKMYL